MSLGNTMFSHNHSQESSSIVHACHYCGSTIKIHDRAQVDTSHLDVHVLPNQVCRHDIKAGMYIYVANPFCSGILAYHVNYGLVINDRWLCITPINDVARMLNSHNNLISLHDSGIADGVSANKFARTFTTLDDANRWCAHVKSHPSFEIEKAYLALKAKQAKRRH